MDRFLLVFVGGGLGSALRYLVSVSLARVLPTFPLGTLCVNLVGSLLMGLLMQIALSSSAFSPSVRLTLTTGFVGGFTTYSTFNYETTKLLQDGSAAVAFANLSATLFGCLLAGIAGAWLGQRLVTP